MENIQLLQSLLLQHRLSVGTVDSFQGQECDIIAITVTRSNSQGEIDFLSDICRINVVMTCARRKLLLVGGSSTLCRHPFFVELLAYVKGVGANSKSCCRSLIYLRLQGPIEHLSRILDIRCI